MLPVFRRIQRWLCQHKHCLLRVTSHVVEYTPVPKFLHQVPVSDYTSFNRVNYFLRTHQIPGLLADGKVKSLSNLFVAHGPGGLGALISGISDEGGDVEGRLGVACVAHFGIACAVVNDCNLAIEVHTKDI